jgi:1,4-alpha-glucan branching enzyme
MRGKVLFVFNFNPLESFSDYGICVAAGSYRLLLDSDEACFGGYARLKPAQKYVTQPLDDEDDRHMLKLYLPNRTALVLLREA